MNYRIVICDDNKVDVDYIFDLASAWSKSSENTVNISTFSSAEAFLFHYADNETYDILLLDIEMDGMDGVTLAREIRKDNEAVQIIFITGYSDYISEGYDVSALHYLMKPVHKEKVFEILERAVQKVKKNEQVMILELSGEMIRIPLYEIRYFEVQKNYVTIHAKQNYTVKKTLKEFEAELDDRFFRIGRSFIVNLLCIIRITKTDVYLSGDAVIPLSRGQYEPLNRAIISHT